jgi:hypothetical protein
LQITGKPKHQKPQLQAQWRKEIEELEAQPVCARRLTRRARVILRVFLFPGIPCLFNFACSCRIVKAAQLNFCVPFWQLFADAEERLQALHFDFRQVFQFFNIRRSWVDFTAGTATILSSFSPPSTIFSTPIGRSLSSVPVPLAHGYRKHIQRITITGQ